MIRFNIRPIEWTIIAFMIGAILQYGRLIERVDSIAVRLVRIERVLDEGGRK